MIKRRHISWRAILAQIVRGGGAFLPLKKALGKICMRTKVGDIYISLMRTEKPYDKHHVISYLFTEQPIIVSTQDGCVCRAIRLTGYWDRSETRALMHLVKPGQTIVEVGANYGYYTLLMSDKLQGDGQIISYEANSDVARYLKDTLRLNALEKTVHLKALAASDHAFSSILVYNLNNIGGGHLLEDVTKKEDIGQKDICRPFQAVTLDDDLNHFSSIDLLRIDAEGSEAAIIKGATKLIDRSPNLIIVMEWAACLLIRYGVSLREFAMTLQSKGFKAWKIEGNSGALLPLTLETWLDINDDYANLVLSRQELTPQQPSGS